MSRLQEMLAADPVGLSTALSAAGDVLADKYPVDASDFGQSAFFGAYICGFAGAAQRTGDPEAKGLGGGLFDALFGEDAGPAIYEKVVTQLFAQNPQVMRGWRTGMSDGERYFLGHVQTLDERFRGLLTCFRMRAVDVGQTLDTL